MNCVQGSLDGRDLEYHTKVSNDNITKFKINLEKIPEEQINNYTATTEHPTYNETYNKTSKFLCFISLTELELKLKTYRDGTITIQDFRTLQDLDEEINAFGNKEEGSGGLLCVKTGESLIPLLPACLSKNAITALHFSPFNCHLSHQAIKRKIEQRFYLIKIDDKIQDIINGCPYCTQAVVHRDPKHTFQANQLPASPRQQYYVDIIGGLNESKGFKWIYIAVCPYSGYTILKAAKGKSGKEMQEFILYSIICPHGIFKILSMDQEWGPELSTEFKVFLDRYGIEKNISAVEAHFSVGIVERVVAKVKETARKLTSQTRYEWPDIIGIINSSLNKTVLSYGLSSEQVLYGQELDNSWSPLILDVLDEDQQQYFEKIHEITKENQKYIKNKRIERQKTTLHI